MFGYSAKVRRRGFTPFGLFCADRSALRLCVALCAVCVHHCSTPSPHIPAITSPARHEFDLHRRTPSAARARHPSSARDTANRTTTRALQLARERKLLADEATQLAHEQRDAERRRLERGLGDSLRGLQTEEIAMHTELVTGRARCDVRQRQAAIAPRVPRGGAVK